MVTSTMLNIVGLCFGIIGALLMSFYPPRVTQYTSEGKKVVGWQESSTSEEGVLASKLKMGLSRLGPVLLVLGFASQLGATLL